MPKSTKFSRAAEKGMMRSTDVARLLGITQQRVDQLARMERLPAFHMVGVHRMWDRVEIEEWAEECWFGTRPWRVRYSTTE